MLKKLLRIFLVFWLLLFIGAGVALWYANDYLESNQEKLLHEYLATKGMSVSLREVRLEIWKDWPEVRLTVDSLVVRDTTQATRVPELINAQRIRAKVDLDNLLAGRIRIQEIRMIDAQVHLESDSAGVFNLGYLADRDTVKTKLDTLKDAVQPNYISVDWEGLTAALDNVNLKFIHPKKRKNIEVLARSLSAVVDRNEERELCVDANVDFHFTDLAFNTDKGSYLRGKDLSGPLDVVLGEEVITLHPANLSVAGMDLRLAAEIHKEKTDTSYIDVSSEAIDYATAQSILPEELQEKLADYTVTGAFPAHVSIATPLGPGNDPRLEIDYVMSGQDVRLKEHQFDKVYATGTLINRLSPAEGGIPNSPRNLRVRAKNVKAYYLGNVLIETDRVDVRIPGRDAILRANLDISGPARAVSDYLRNDAFFFKRGKFRLKAGVNASLLDFEEIIQTTDGEIAFYNTEVFYGPAGISFPFRAIRTVKDGQDIRYGIVSRPLRTGFSFDLNGKIDNIVPLLMDQPAQRITTDVNFHTERFDWRDFRALFGEDGRLVSDDEELVFTDGPAPKKNKGAAAGAGEVGEYGPDGRPPLDTLTEAQQVAAMKASLMGIEKAFHPNFSMKFDTVKYYDVFTLTDFTTGLHFVEDTLRLEKTSFDWSGSDIQFAARLDMNEPSVTPFDVEFVAQHLNLNRLRNSLDYFGVALPKELETLPSDLHIDFQHRGRIADSIGIVGGYNYGRLLFDDGRDELFSGTLQYEPSETDGSIQTKFHLNGDPQVVNVLFAAENFFFGEGRFAIDLDLDGTPEDLPALLKTGRMDLSIDSSRILYRPGQVYIPVRHFDVKIAEERADYSLKLVTDSTNRTIRLDGYLDQLAAFMFPDTIEATAPFHVKADIRADALSYPDLLSLIQSQRDNFTSSTDSIVVDSLNSIAGTETVTDTVTKASSLKQVLSTTGGVFNSFRPELSLEVDTFILSPRTTLLDLATGMRVRNNNELVLERTGFLIDDGKVEIDAVYALDSLAVSPFHANYRIENIDLDQLVGEFAKVNPEVKKQIGEISGRLNLHGEMNGWLNERIQQVIFDSTTATLNYDLQNIVLTDWPQLLEVGKKAKMQRRFERLGLAPLSGYLEMNHGVLPIPRMEIQTTALQLFLEGQYSLADGPDLLVSVPVWSNLFRGVLDEAPPKEGYAHAGWKVYLTMKMEEEDPQADKPKTGFLLSRRKYYKKRGELEEWKALRSRWKNERKTARQESKVPRNTEKAAKQSVTDRRD
ncbi:hypothetical protein [Lewinella sp. 4G2]|uniref:hypothetical protein n=1 Tax=Lewinella sp. 4G2 TaxID=1803372 RepID=UPI0007B49C02|nr:hypothetical protein [Lewinella sp. 4G2]OAV44012.1 hypothetical protein A3850_005665 [Lewinella sp. 4G2]